MNHQIIIIILGIFLMMGCKSTNKLLQNQRYNIFTDELDSYSTSGDATWAKSGSVISCNSGEGYIYTNRAFQYFHLKAEFLADDSVNSGIFFGCEGPEVSAPTCFEANIWDNHPNQEFRTGSLVTRQQPMSVVNTVNKWSIYEIKSEPGKIRIWINGILTVNYEVNEVKPGPVIFQKFGEGSIQFRNVRIHTL